MSRAYPFSQSQTYIRGAGPAQLIQEYAGHLGTEGAP